MSKSTDRVAYLDGLRAIAAVAVLGQHLTELTAPVRFHWFLEAGPGVTGVVLFFYISGAVIPLSVHEHTTISTFTLRRIFRIFPAYLVALLLVAGLAFGQRQPTLFERIGPWGTLANVLLLQDYFHVPALLGVTWTLSIELIWYGLFIVLWLYMRRFKVELLVLAFSACMVIVSLVSLRLGIRFPAGRIGLLGAALCGYLTWQRQALRLRTRAYVIAVCTFLGAQLFALYVAFGVFAHPSIKLHHSVLPWLAASVLFLASANVQQTRNVLGLTRAPVVWLGERSYSMYLLHVPICQAGLACLDPRVALFAAPVAVTVLAALSFRFVELPGIRTGRQLAVLAGRRVAS